MPEWKEICRGPLWEGGDLLERTYQMELPTGSLFRTMVYQGQAGGLVTVGLVWAPDTFFTRMQKSFRATS